RRRNRLTKSEVVCRCTIHQLSFSCSRLLLNTAIAVQHVKPEPQGRPQTSHLVLGHSAPRSARPIGRLKTSLITADRALDQRTATGATVCRHARTPTKTALQRFL